jgi:hypothetical protein
MATNEHVGAAKGASTERHSPSAEDEVPPAKRVKLELKAAQADPSVGVQDGPTTTFEPEESNVPPPSARAGDDEIRKSRAQLRGFAAVKEECEEARDHASTDCD